MDAHSFDQPIRPQPPESEINRVFPDLATLFAESELDSNGRRVIGRDALFQGLQAKGHSNAATEWALFKLCESGLLFSSTYKAKRTRVIRPGVQEIVPQTVEIPAIAVSEEFWDRCKSQSLVPRAKEIILLIHGIRTFAWWQPMVKRVLEEIPNVEVWEGHYGYFDAIRFWCPFFTRKAPIDEVRAELEKAMSALSKAPDGRLSVIAHSYGTYVLTTILATKLDLRLHRLVLCGSIVPRKYPWHALGNRIDAFPSSARRLNVINDYGLRDRWPVFAKSLSWGYGDTGRHKFGKAEVVDRAHDLDHSGFFTHVEPGKDLEPGEAFVRKFWKPWFESGKVVDSKVQGDSPLWLCVLSITPVQWIVFVLLLAAVILSVLYSPTSSQAMAGGAGGQGSADTRYPQIKNIVATSAQIEAQLVQYDAVATRFEGMGKDLLAWTPDMPFEDGPTKCKALVDELLSRPYEDMMPWEYRELLVPVQTSLEVGFLHMKRPRERDAMKQEIVQAFITERDASREMIEKVLEQWALLSADIRQYCELTRRFALRSRDAIAFNAVNEKYNDVADKFQARVRSLEDPPELLTLVIELQQLCIELNASAVGKD